MKKRKRGFFEIDYVIMNFGEEGIEPMNYSQFTWRDNTNRQSLFFLSFFLCSKTVDICQLVRRNLRSVSFEYNYFGSNRFIQYTHCVTPNCFRHTHTHTHTLIYKNVT